MASVGGGEPQTGQSNVPVSVGVSDVLDIDTLSHIAETIARDLGIDGDAQDGSVVWLVTHQSDSFFHILKQIVGNDHVLSRYSHPTGIIPAAVPWKRLFVITLLSALTKATCIWLLRKVFPSMVRGWRMPKSGRCAWSDPRNTKPYGTIIRCPDV